MSMMQLAKVVMLGLAGLASAYALPVLKLNAETPYLDAAALHEAFSSEGIAVLTGWNTSFTTLFTEAQAASAALFSSREMESVHMGDVSPMRGYIPTGAESGLVDSVYEPKEGYSYGHPSLSSAKPVAADVGAAKDLLSANVWPADAAPATVSALEDFYLVAAAVAELVGDTLGVELGNMGRGGSLNSLLRLFHYFPTADVAGGSSEEGLKVLGSSPHTDWGYVTVILQDLVGGLQVASQSQNGEWVDVPAVPGSLVVIAGDYMRAVSGQRYLSPVHRVVAPQHEHRTSFVYFHYPLHSKPLPPRETATEKGGYNTLYDAVDSSPTPIDTFGEYMVLKWAGVLRANKQAVTSEL